jgi:2'-5' RNA ligase
MRIFFGLETDPDTAMGIADWRDRQFPQAGRPVPPANFHITLAFVGEVMDQQLEQICQAIDNWLDSGAPARGQLTLDQTGYWHKPGIYWLGPSSWPQELSGLSRKLKSLARASGAKRDRNSFQPHLTLFRGCKTAPPAPTASPAFRFAYDQITLFESRQGRRGVSYHPLESWQLGPFV